MKYIMHDTVSEKQFDYERLEEHDNMLYDAKQCDEAHGFKSLCALNKYFTVKVLCPNIAQVFDGERHVATVDYTFEP